MKTESKMRMQRHVSQNDTGRRAFAVTRSRACLLALILAFTAVLFAVSSTTVTARAEGYTIYSNGMSYQIGQTEQVQFNGKPWFVVAANSSASNPGTVTLFAADTSFGVSAFNTNGSKNYNGSKIANDLKAYTDSGAFKAVADAIKTVTLSDAGNMQAKLYLPQQTDVMLLPESVICLPFEESTDNKGYWLRTPDEDNDGCGWVAFGVPLVYQGSNILFGNGRYVSTVCGVRPMLELDLTKAVYQPTTKAFVTVPVESVTLNKTSTLIMVPETETLTATVKPDNAFDKTVTWESSNKSVATVANGVVTAVGAGTANITAKAGEKSATCVVTVHAHTLAVTVDGDKATVECSDANCPDKQTYTVTLSVTDKVYDATPLEAKVTKSDKFPASLTVKAVTYSGRGGTSYSSSATAPTNVGTYTASVEVGDKTVKKDFEIKPQEPITYLSSMDYDPSSNTLKYVTSTITQYLLVTPERKAWANNWYVVKGNVVINGPVTYGKNVMLLLCDGASLTVKGGIKRSGSELSIYGQESQSGLLAVEGAQNEPVLEGGTITFNGGKLDLTLGANGSLFGNDAAVTFNSAVDIQAKSSTGEVMVIEAGKTYRGSELNAYSDLFASTKQNPEIQTEPAARTDLTYTGEKQALIAAGTAKGGTLYYALATDADKAPADDLYAKDIPTATDTGAYSVWYKVVGDADYCDMPPVKLTVTIDPADKTALNEAIASAKAYYDTIKDYVETAKALKSAIAEAKAVAANDNAAPSEITAATSAINAATEKARSAVESEDNQDAAQKVIDAITAIPEKAGVDDKDAVAAARAAYEALTDVQKKLVGSDALARLTAAETQVKAAEDAAAAQAVIDAVSDLPRKAGVDDKKAIDAAREAYEALTEEQKALVGEKLLARLAAAETQLEAAEEEAGKVNIAKCTIKVKDQTYTGKKLKPSVKVKYNGKVLTKGKDYKLTYSNNQAVGTAKVKVTGIGAYTGSRNMTFKIKAVKIGKCAITVKDQTYTGKAITPKVTVKFGKTKLKEGQDYTLTYNQKAKKVGRVKVVIKGKGNFKGSKTVAFNIIPQGTSFTEVTGNKKSITLNWMRQKNISGYQIEYSLKKDFSDTWTVTVKKAGTLTETIDKLKAKKTYYVHIRTYKDVKNACYYSAWSKAKAVKTQSANAEATDSETIEYGTQAVDGLDEEFTVDEESALMVG